MEELERIKQEHSEKVKDKIERIATKLQMVDLYEKLKKDKSSLKQAASMALLAMAFDIVPDNVEVKIRDITVIDFLKKSMHHKNYKMAFAAILDLSKIIDEDLGTWFESYIEELKIRRSREVDIIFT